MANLQWSRRLGWRDVWAAV